MALGISVSRPQLVTGVVLGVGFLLGVSLVVAPSTIRKQECEKILSDTQMKSDVVGKIVALEQKLGTLEGPFLNPRDEDWLQRRVTELAEQTNVKVLSMEPQPREMNAGFQRITVRAEVRASYHGIGDFLSALEGSSEYLKVDTVQAVRAGELEAEGGAAPQEEGAEGSVELEGSREVQWKIAVSTFYKLK